MWRTAPIVFLLLTSVAAAYQWTAHGPASETLDFYTHEAEPYYTVLCGSESLHVETGSGWMAYGMAGLPFVSATGLAGDTMLVAVGDGSWSDGIYRFDLTSGQFSVMTWTPWPRFLIEAGERGPYYAGFEYGLVKSENGSLWAADSFFTGMTCCAMATQGAHYVVAVDDGVCWSDDGGQTWHHVAGTPLLSDLAFASNGMLYGVFPGFSYSSGLWSSVNYGQTWNVEFWSTEVSAVALDPQEVVFVGWEGGAMPGGVAIWTPELHDVTHLNAGLPSRQVRALRRNGLIDTPSMMCCTQEGAHYVTQYLWPPTLSLEMAGAGVARLTWTSLGSAEQYEVFRGTSAFFTAEGAPWATVMAPAVTLDITEGIGDPGANYFFRVRARNASQVTNPSNAVGELDFETIIPMRQLP